MNLVDVEYKALLTDENLDNSSADNAKDDVLQTRSTWTQRHIIFWIATVVHIIITLSLALSLCYVTHAPWHEGCQTRSSLEAFLYSPAQEAVTYKLTQFILGPLDGPPKTLFGADPSSEVDEAWVNLYNEFGISQIPEAQAKLLVNKMLPIPGDPGNYVVALSVFHELHCLNVIRKALHPDDYVDPVTGDIGNIVKADLPYHLNHCIDTIRQALMCAVDITPHVWHWDEERQKALPAFDDVAHVCRDYDKIVDWAKAHRHSG
ncbi:hypothetical protein EW026_g6644 [Hermanssonia centrifuga]|uniref:Cyclochlorotine biosynthesis protein O n=1 Tax=Hermanssonia centrifuga TaxID=98765 RepID=A0A4S4KAC1_9APHY|nr:hypothetical protein EW026_g6644 [Hermanssonia centrifuga]